MRRFFRITSSIAAIITLVSFVIYFFTFDKWDLQIIKIIIGIGFLGISLMLITMQYEYRHGILNDSKKKIGNIVLVASIFLSIVFLTLAIFQFCK